MIRLPLAWTMVLAGTLLAWAGPAAAHSFDIAVVAPFSGPRAAEGAAFWQGMRVATREADGHAGETSDGHLGGIDSNLRKLDSAGDPATLRTRLEAAFAPGAPRLVALAPGARPAWGAAGLSADVLIAPGAPLEGALTPPPPESGDFAARYRADYGEDPGPAAAAGYASARLIDRAVRRLDRPPRDAQALRESLAR